jgi:hypothetical protein
MLTALPRSGSTHRSSAVTRCGQVDLDGGEERRKRLDEGNIPAQEHRCSRPRRHADGARPHKSYLNSIMASLQNEHSFFIIGDTMTVSPVTAYN